MTYNTRDLEKVRNAVLLTSLATWTLLLVAPGGVVMHSHPPGAAAAPLQASLAMLLAMNPPASLAAGWFLMLVAMMSPVLIPPVHHIRQRSFASRRMRSVAIFVTAYAAIWMVVGGILLALDLAVKFLAPQSNLPAIGVALIAIVWQCSPPKQRCLNRCHAHRELAAFGAAADFDALRFGSTHGIWCVASCWALMLFPMLLPQGHLVAMAAVTVLIFGERLEPPAPPRWQWRGTGKLKRIMAWQLSSARNRLSEV